MKPAFWFVMSISLVVGFLLPYPMNWWLVAKGMKHGMLTVGKEEASEAPSFGEPIPKPGSAHGAGNHADHFAAMNHPSSAAKAWMTILSFVCLVIGLALAFSLRGERLEKNLVLLLFIEASSSLIAFKIIKWDGFIT